MTESSEESNNTGVIPDSGALRAERRHTPLRRSQDRIFMQAQAFVKSLEMIGDGVLLLDKDGAVVSVSESAKAILRGMEQHIRIQDNRLRLANAKDEQQMTELLAQIRKNADRVPSASVITVERPASGQPLLLSLFPLANTAPEESLSPCLMIIFRNPDVIPTPQWQIFASHFQLSASEMKLCLALADGLSVADFSEKYNTSPHTTRTHLRSVFAKTSTRRQADLLRLIFAFTRL